MAMKKKAAKKAAKRAAPHRAGKAVVVPQDNPEHFPHAPTKRSKSRLISSSVLNLIPDAFSIMSELKDELETWKDGIPENLQSGEKYATLEESCDTIDNVSEITPSEELEKALENVEASYTAARKRPSRSDRRCEACEMIRSAAEAIGTYIEEHKDLSEDLRDELERLAEECTAAADEWDNVEFPGMFG